MNECIKTNEVLKVLKVSTYSSSTDRFQLSLSLYMAMWTSCRLRCPDLRGAHITLSKRKSVDEHENPLSFMAQTTGPHQSHRRQQVQIKGLHTWYLVRSQEAWWDSPGEEIPSSSTDDYGHRRNLPTHVFPAWCDVCLFLRCRAALSFFLN